MMLLHRWYRYHAPLYSQWRSARMIRPHNPLCRLFSTGNNNNNNEKKEELLHVRPYSGSLPSPGHEWCRRCSIPIKSLQKPVGRMDAWYYRSDLCEPARRYYHRQYAFMAFWAALVFVVLPPGVQLGRPDDHDEYETEGGE